jgi:phosphatidylserine decarboxylase
MSIRLIDNKKTAIAFSSDVYYGNVTYNFKLTVFGKRGDTVIPVKVPEVRVE